MSIIESYSRILSALGISTSKAAKYLADLADLKSTADCVLYAYGSGGGMPEQETPAYMIELAEKNPNKTYEMIHCDRSFNERILQKDNPDQAPVCFRSNDWILQEPHEMDVYRFRHARLPNLKVKLLNFSFPSNAYHYFAPQFQNYIESKLSHGAEIFFGVHNACWTDLQCCLGDTYNQFRKAYPNKIHFYIQAGPIPAFIYKGPYLPLFGEMAKTIHVSAERETCEAFTRVFSLAPPSEADIDKVGQIFQNSLPTILPTEDKPREKTSSPEDLFKCLYNRDEYRVIVLPLNQLTAQIWRASPGQEHI